MVFIGFGFLWIQDFTKILFSSLHFVNQKTEHKNLKQKLSPIILCERNVNLVEKATSAKIRLLGLCI